jgi:hypothetical protein
LFHAGSLKEIKAGKKRVLEIFAGPQTDRIRAPQASVGISCEFV